MPDDAAEIARIVAEQRAKPEDLLPAPEPSPTAPVEAAPEPTPEPEAEPVAAEAEAEPTETPAAKPKKTATDFLTGRVGNLSAKLNESAAREAALQARLEAAEALLNARGTPLPEGEQQAPAPAPVPSRTDPTTGRTYTDAEFQAAVVATAARQAFNQQADEVYNTGKGAFTDWDQTVQVLNASGLMSEPLLEAAIAVGDQKTSAALFHYLGSDLDEAQRVAQLSGPRLGVELARIASKIAAPVEQRISKAPAPIPDVRGAVNPVVDLAKASEGDSNDMSAWIAARKRQGDPYAMSRKDRAAANSGRA